MKFLGKINQAIDRAARPVYFWILARVNPTWWILDRRAESILDVGCGQGLPMELIRVRKKVYAVGLDGFEPYIDACREKGIHDEYVLGDVRKLPFDDRSFDVVLCLQVIEHLPKEDGYAVIKELERIAKRQVIVSMPVGEMEHPAVDDNPLQIHRSAWTPAEFQRMGYRTRKQGLKILLGEHGIVHRINVDLLRKLIFVLDMLLAPVLYVLPFLADYYFVASKPMAPDDHAD